MAALRDEKATRLEAARRRVQAAEAGRIAAASPFHVSKRGVAERKQPKRRR
jgi:hypothetical protein